MSNLNEELLANDLVDLVDKIFEIDSYSSKMGSDKDVVVLSFNVGTVEAAKDMVNFIERGYDFVLDGDYSAGELRDNKYKVFVEIQRDKRIAKNIMELLYGLERLTKLDMFKFRYYKSFHSIPATLEMLTDTVPATPEDYDIRISQQHLNNFSNFFSRSYLESVSIDNDDIIFQKRFSEPLRMRIIDFGDKTEVYDNVEGSMMFESRDVGEVVYLTKYIGDYSISKIGTSFVFEHKNKALVLQKV